MKRLSFVFIFLTVILTGCRKNQLKKPTDLSIKMDINRDYSSQGHLVFDEGSLTITDFKIDGDRIEGESISFKKSFPDGLTIPFDQNNTISELAFDIPQGEYEELVISFFVEESGSSNALEVKGVYTNSSSVSYPVLFEFNDNERISIVGEDEENDITIVLDKDTPANAFIKLDPVYWFGLVSNNLFDNAELVLIDGQQTILVNSSTNEDIYDVVVDRMEESAMAIWGDQ